MSSAKAQKEAFVTGHSGTSVPVILIVCASAPIGIFLFHEVRNYLERRCKSRHVLSRRLCIGLESWVILWPMTICQTVLLFPWGVCILVFELLLASMLHWQRIRQERNLNLSNEKESEKKDDLSSRLDFLTFYRSTVSYLTFVAILAVDFPIFPREFAKTETSGYGLMDLGAASFCISGGFVSWYARQKNDSGKKCRKGRLQQVILRSIPLVGMGILRLVTTKGLEYQEHVSEYGIHWNFFFTLSVVGILSTTLRCVLNLKNPLGWIFILLGYQYVLSEYGLQQYMEHASRQCSPTDDEAASPIGFVSSLCHFFAANREGTMGILGYLVLHLASEDIAKYCLWGCQRKEQGMRLGCVTALSWMVHYFLVSGLGIPVSRRSTNASFVAWAMAHNLTILWWTWWAFQLGNTAKRSDKYLLLEANPPIFAAVNRHGLVVFIMANLMTGAVNLSMDTLHASHARAIIVIFLYLCAVGGLALALDWNKNGRGRKNHKITKTS